MPAQGQRDAYHAREQEGTHPQERGLLDHHPLEKIGGGSSAQSGNWQGEKHHPRQVRQLRLVKERGYERRAKEQYRVKRQADQRAEPENGIILIVCGGALIGQGGGEAALLQCAGYGREDGEHAHQSVVGRGKQARQEDAQHNIEQLHGAVVHHAPKKALGGFLLQCLHRQAFTFPLATNRWNRRWQRFL